LQLTVAEQSSSRMVVDVKKGQRLLLEHEEERVYELPVLDVVVDDVECLESHGPCPLSTDRIESAISLPDGNHLFQHQSKQPSRSSAEKNIMYQKGILEVASRDYWLFPRLGDLD
jgi:hypothetical protein